MSKDELTSILSLAGSIKESIDQVILPPSEVTISLDQPVLPNSLFRNTRGYIDKIAIQINRTYKETCYDACAVMIRRLVEILIIESFEKNGLASKIKNANGNYYFLEDLINITLKEKSWSLGRNSKSGLRKFKKIGDQSAHSRRYNARREYIDDVIIVLRTVSEELLYLSGLRI